MNVLTKGLGNENLINKQTLKQKKILLFRTEKRRNSLQHSTQWMIYCVHCSCFHSKLVEWEEEQKMENFLDISSMHPWGFRFLCVFLVVHTVVQLSSPPHPPPTLVIQIISTIPHTYAHLEFHVFCSPY